MRQTADQHLRRLMQGIEGELRDQVPANFWDVGSGVRGPLINFRHPDDRYRQLLLARGPRAIRELSWQAGGQVIVLRHAGSDTSNNLQCPSAYQAIRIWKELP